MMGCELSQTNLSLSKTANGIVATGATAVECNLTCTDGSICGGKNGWTSVYPALPAAPTVQGLAISIVAVSVPNVVNVSFQIIFFGEMLFFIFTEYIIGSIFQTAVTLNINVTTNASLLDFYINPGDGSETAWFPGDTSPSVQLSYSKPGSFIISGTFFHQTLFFL